MRPEYTVKPPSRRADGTFMYPLQIVLSEHGKWETGKAHFETVGWACSLEHLDRLRECLI
jgi:hypothetical protein